MLEGIYICSLFFILFVGGFSIYKIWKCITVPNIITILLLVILFFFWFPVLFDLFIGVPKYDSQFNAFKIAAEDTATCTIYNFYIGLIILVYSHNISNKRLKISIEDIRKLLNQSYKYRYLLFVISISPLFVVCFLNNPFVYILVILNNLDIDLADDPSMIYLMGSTFLSAITSSLLLVVYGRKKKKLIIIGILILIVCTILLNGKRFLVPLVLIIYIGLYYFCGIKNKYRFLLVLIFLLVLFCFFVYFYGKNISDSFDDTYMRLRIDFGRDDVTKYTIYTVLIKGDEILEYPMQSFLFDFTFWVPRDFWEDKPQPYAVYFISSLLGLREIRYPGWSMTTSIVEESIANLNFFGLLIPFFLISVLCKINKLPIYARLSGLLFVVTMFVVQFSAMNLLFIFFFVLCVLKK